MSAGLLLTDIASYSIQVLALVAVGGILPSPFRVHHPRAQLLYLRLLLAACLLLPAFQPWRRPVVVLPPPEAPATVGTASTPSPVPASAPIRWDEVAVVVLVAGAALRALWLLLGLWRLRRYRIGSTLLDPLPAPMEDARQRTGAGAAVMVSAEAGGPVTFGALRPVILIPPELLDQPADVQFGVACHEFLHVRRHDWLYTVIEEFVGALVWFHPAIWWLLSRIRLTREQVVDSEVVVLSEAREPYVQSLLAMGGAPPLPDLAPATLFFRKRQLSSRIHSLLREVTMSKGRLVSCYVLTAVALVAAAWFVTASFPLEASPLFQAQQGTSSEPLDYVAVSVSGFSEPVHSKMLAQMEVFQGRRYSPELRAEIARAAKEVDPSARVPLMNQIETAEGSLLTTFVVSNHADAAYVPGGSVAIDVSILSEPLQSTMRARLAGFDGQQYTPGLRSKIVDAAREIDARAGVGRVQQLRAADGRLMTTLGITLNEAGPASPPTSETRILVNGADQNLRLANMVRPKYPPAAREARIQGTVRFEAVIDKEGRVANLTLVGGHPLLAPAAAEAVRQWTYQPTLLNGQPVEVITQIDLNFTLSEGSRP